MILSSSSIFNSAARAAALRATAAAEPGNSVNTVALLDNTEEEEKLAEEAETTAREEGTANEMDDDDDDELVLSAKVPRVAIDRRSEGNDGASEPLTVAAERVFEEIEEETGGNTSTSISSPSSMTMTSAGRIDRDGEGTAVRRLEFEEGARAAELLCSIDDDPIPRDCISFAFDNAFSVAGIEKVDDTVVIAFIDEDCLTGLGSTALLATTAITEPSCSDC